MGIRRFRDLEEITMVQYVDSRQPDPTPTRGRRRAWNAAPVDSEPNEAPLWYVLTREVLGYAVLAAVPLVCIASGSVLGLLMAPVFGGMVIGFIITAAVEGFAGETPRQRRVLLLRIPMMIAIQLAVLSEYIAAAMSSPSNTVSLAFAIGGGILIGLLCAVIRRGWSGR